MTRWPRLCSPLRRLAHRLARRLGARASLLDPVGPGQGPLKTARALGERAARVGFDWPGPEEALEKVAEETQELREALAQGSPDHVEDELGDLLFAACMVARKADVDAGAALARTNAKFRRRFAAIERELAAQGIEPAQASLAQMEQIWQRAKHTEGPPASGR